MLKVILCYEKLQENKQIAKNVLSQKFLINFLIKSSNIYSWKIVFCYENKNCQSKKYTSQLV